MTAKPSSFSNHTVVLCRPDDQELAERWHEAGGFEQDDDGPIRIVIGVQTSDEKCARLGERFGVEAQRLITFRDTDTLKRVVVVDARHG